MQAETAYDVRVHSRNAIENSQWTQSATAFSTLAGTAATGAPAITGTAAVGQPLAVDLTGIEDADGLAGVSYSYQWVRVDADGLSNAVDITDATDATYTLVDADLGKTIKVQGDLRRRRRQYRDADQRADGDGDPRGRGPWFAEQTCPQR